MICDVCKSAEAKVHLTEIVGGKMKKVNLCHGCAKAKGVDNPTGFGLADVFLGLGNTQEIEHGAATAQCCPACGFSQADFKKTGRLGCAKCYETFSDGLTSLLKAMHKGTHHTGKVPSRISRQIERENTLKVLQRDLQKAVADENYESAAQIRDQLRQMETSADA
ncbi:MAG: UvrB/UvrC motif-containing protein [Chthoniobacteraceae bacterium]|jgi:protein arginine kinase activator